MTYSVTSVPKQDLHANILSNPAESNH